MGVFQETVTLVNRTSKPLTVTFDGQQSTIKPGENTGFPKVAVQYAKNQNKKRGTEKWNDPISGEYLVGVKGTKDNITPTEDNEDEPCFVSHDEKDEDLGPKEHRKLRGKKFSAYEARAGVSTSPDGALFGEDAR